MNYTVALVLVLIAFGVLSLGVLILILNGPVFSWQEARARQRERLLLQQQWFKDLDEEGRDGDVSPDPSPVPRPDSDHVRTC